MNSTKYQLLRDDFNHACDQLRHHKKAINELNEELNQKDQALRDIIYCSDIPASVIEIAKKALKEN
jgi:23S rRNA G2445 N2-methylase RlmL